MARRLVSEPWLFPPTPDEEYLARERDERERARREYWAKKRFWKKEVFHEKAQNVSVRVAQFLYPERASDSSQK